MPLIEIDQEVWDILQEKARPLGVTTNDILRNILKIEPKYISKEKPQIKDKIKQKEMIPDIVNILKENGGIATKEFVDEKIFQLYRDVFEQNYYQQKVSNGIPRWKHNVAWAKEIAKNMGLIEPPSMSGRGMWKLTDKGMN
ncbi:winged helix-turn-helix domain-containing protein [candidate division KSB1 bacterium]|nr:winged helix-turn-helix domain-containing protein [candidate division KSB1 bacterium]